MSFYFRTLILLYITPPKVLMAPIYSTMLFEQAFIDNQWKCRHMTKYLSHKSACCNILLMATLSLQQASASPTVVHLCYPYQDSHFISADTIGIEHLQYISILHNMNLLVFYCDNRSQVQLMVTAIVVYLFLMQDLLMQDLHNVSPT